MSGSIDLNNISMFNSELKLFFSNLWTLIHFESKRLNPQNQIWNQT